MSKKEIAQLAKQFFECLSFVTVDDCEDKGTLHIIFDNLTCRRMQERLRDRREATATEKINEAIDSIQTRWPSYSLCYVSTSMRTSLVKTRDTLVGMGRMLATFDTQWGPLRERALNLVAQAERTSGAAPAILDTAQSLLDWMRQVEEWNSDTRNPVNLLQIRIALNEMQDSLLGARQLMSHTGDLRVYYVKPLDDILASAN